MTLIWPGNVISSEICAAISVDIRGRRIFERWQLEDQVAVPLLAEVRLS